ncbi:BnaC09g33720D [Brassica napus]|uniref:BnaC09g33720D protein n=2 Tax=Brassica napus TaxID=3708 RepID=A0A078I235_BRANA|nr:BnaC09g33720D [Brassica napus]
MSHLVLDMRKTINANKNLDVANRVATLITKIIDNHRGQLESCVIDHYTDDMIQSLTRVKQTKHLTLRHQPGHMYHGGCIEFPPNSFTYPRLTSLSLHGYVLRTSHSFNNCQNLKTLKLSCILASDLGVFNSVLASCPSLEVLVLDISCFKESGPLKIDNKRLKLLQVLETKKIDGIQVSSTRLDSLAIGRLSCGKDDFVLRCPRLRFYRNVWLAGLCYNISQEEKNSGHEEFVVTTSDLFRYFPTASLSVSLDLMNPRQVERLRQVLNLWKFTMIELEILFTNNYSPREEGESPRNKFLEENNKDHPFPNAKFRVETVWMHNFSSSEEEFALASCLIRQGTVIKRMMIKSTSFPAWKKLEIETAVAKLQALIRKKEQWQLAIKCF